MTSYALTSSFEDYEAELPQNQPLPYDDQLRQRGYPRFHVPLASQPYQCKQSQPFHQLYHLQWHTRYQGHSGLCDIKELLDIILKGNGE